MTRSMTAFGSAVKKTPIGQVTVEIQSYNRKHLEIRIQSPSELSRFSIPIQNQIGETVKRGAVTVHLFVEYSSEIPVRVTPNLPLAKEYRDSVFAMAKELGISGEGLLERMLGRASDLFQVCDKEVEEGKYLSALSEVVESALARFENMRQFEGEKLKKDMEDRLSFLSRSLGKIEERSAGSVEKQKGKLKELLEGIDTSDPLYVREICLFADRVDIAEELTRFRSHIDHFKSTLAKEIAIGKTLDFLLQELMRETNTIGSKSQDPEIAYLVVEMKAELERIREQVQNIE